MNRDFVPRGTDEGHSETTNYFAHQASELAIGISLGLISTFAVALRFLARTRSRVDVALDDWLIVVALLIFLGIFGIGFWNASQGGYGYDISTLPIPLLEKTLKFFYLANLMTVLIITCAKISVLSLYRRVFITATFRRWTAMMVFACLAWGIAALLMVIFKCTPISASWKIPSKGRCINYSILIAIVESLNCLQDLIIVCMPVGVIWRLQLPPKKKILLGAVFLLGGFVVITSIIRITYIWQFESSDVSSVNSAVWTIIQLTSIIVAACLPTYDTLFPKHKLRVHRSLDWPSNRNRPRENRLLDHDTLLEAYQERRSLPLTNLHNNDNIVSLPSILDNDQIASGSKFSEVGMEQRCSD